mmetsp:Transcript_17709/g.52574  ORF Transcript_17709/g.52574 Transcript_17709/m.52574 type:complete len:235 (+) Transcript_17709:4418-5122(+)
MRLKSISQFLFMEPLLSQDAQTLVIVSCRRTTTALNCSKGSTHSCSACVVGLMCSMTRPVAYFCLGSSSRPESRRSAAWRAASARCSACSCSSACVSSSAVFSASGSSASPRRMKPTNSSTLTPPEQSSSSRRQRPWILDVASSFGFKERPPCEPFARITRSNSSYSRRSFSSVSMALKTLYQLKWPWYHFLPAVFSIPTTSSRPSSVSGAQPSRMSKYKPCWSSAMVTSPLLS